MQIVEEIIYNFENNKSLYIGENITIADHMIQSAMLAEKSKCDDDLICSCLLHDYGHFVIDDPDKLVENNKDGCLLYTSPSPRDYAASRMPSSA